jgi:hypothetical protein
MARRARVLDMPFQAKPRLLASHPAPTRGWPPSRSRVPAGLTVLSIA